MALLGGLLLVVTGFAIALVTAIAARRAGINVDSRVFLVIPWLALNGAGFIYFRGGRSRENRAEFLPINLGARTYRSSTNLGA